MTARPFKKHYFNTAALSAIYSIGTKQDLARRKKIQIQPQRLALQLFLRVGGIANV